MNISVKCGQKVKQNLFLYKSHNVCVINFKWIALSFPKENKNICIYLKKKKILNT